jgi:hypothetical protein
MSWLFVISQSVPNKHTKDQYVHDPPLHAVSLPGVYVAVGGIPETCFFENDAENSTGWAVVGTGLLIGDEDAHIMDKRDWHSLLTGHAFDPATLDGHFVILRWNQSCLEFYTDQLGLRTLYFSNCQNGICISTRLDWVAQSCGKREIDFAALGSRWLMLNQIGYDSGIQGIERLGPNGYARFESGSRIQCTSKPWLPPFKQGTIEHAITILNSIIQSAIDQPYTLSLGLSGGLDSRLLLALLSPYSKDQYGTHTFGHARDPDVQIADTITSALRIQHQHFNEPVPDAQGCISLMHSFAVQTLLSEPVTTIIKIRYYSILRRQHKLLIDGGFGEIARRQYLNRLVRLGHRAVQFRDYPRLIQLMRYHHANFFATEIAERLYKGAVQSLERTLDHMPQPEEIGMANYADLLATRTRVPNWGGPEQARLDGEILSFNPLVQPSFLRSVLMTPMEVRSNGKFYYDLIRTMNPNLTRFAMAKSGGTYPFRISSTAAWLWTKVKSKIRKGFVDPTPDYLLLKIRDYVLDLVHSASVRNNPVYDSRKIGDLVEKYYNGEIYLRMFVDWWLTFELWQKGITSH